MLSPYLTELNIPGCELTREELLKLPQGIFVAHPLKDPRRVDMTQRDSLVGEDLSTALIIERMAEVGMTWPDMDAVNRGSAFCGALPWFSTVLYKDGVPTAVSHFVILPVPHTFFYKSATRLTAARTIEHVARIAWQVLVVQGGAPSLNFAVGAATKNATNHGETLITGLPHDKTKELVVPEWANDPRFSLTHGNGGTAVAAKIALVDAGLKKDDKVTIIGLGSLGRAVAELLVTEIKPGALALVGRPDKPREKLRPDEKARSEVLREVRTALEGRMTSNMIPIMLSQAGETAAHIVGSDFVLMATSGNSAISSGSIPDHSVVCDFTTPASTSRTRMVEGEEVVDEGWANNIVTKGGCARFLRPQDIIPNGFGQIGGETIWDIGCGTTPVDDELLPHAWGCFSEYLAELAEGWRGHSIGSLVTSEHLQFCSELYDRHHIGAQYPDNFGEPMTPADLRAFIDAKREREGWRKTPPEGLDMTEKTSRKPRPSTGSRRAALPPASRPSRPTVSLSAAHLGLSAEEVG